MVYHFIQLISSLADSAQRLSNIAPQSVRQVEQIFRDIVFIFMFHKPEDLLKRTPVDGINRPEFLKQLVQEFRKTASAGNPH